MNLLKRWTLLRYVNILVFYKGNKLKFQARRKAMEEMMKQMQKMCKTAVTLKGKCIASKKPDEFVALSNVLEKVRLLLTAK